MKIEPDKMGNKNNYILFRAVPTMRCNYRCNYCFVPNQEKSTTKTMFDEHAPHEWVRAMKNFKDYQVEFYFWGGEPFLLAGTYEVVKGWTQYEHVISGSRIDTNMAFWDKIAERCPTDKLKLNCSWHTQYDSLDQIYKKVKKLNDLGMVGMTNFVASQYNLKVLQDKYHLSIDDLIEKFDDIDVFVNIAADFLIVNDKDPGTYIDYKRMILKYLCPEDWRQLRCEKSSSFCEANHHYLTIHPNGDITPCLSGQVCGNFFDGTLELPQCTICDKKCPSLVSYCFRTDNSFPYKRHLIEYVNRNREYRKSIRTTKSVVSILNDDLKVPTEAMTSLTPHVSIVLPTYNHLKLLPKAIESILTQTYSNFELIIVNDGSTDGTRDFLDSLKDPRIRVIHQENKRLPEALNTGFRAAHGELLTWISSDNYCEPTFLEVFVSAMDANPNAGLAYSDFARINEHDQIIKVTRCPDMDYSHLLLSFPGMASFMYRRTCQDKVGFYDPALEGAEDWDMWLRIAEHFPIIYVPKILYYYRQHTESLTTHKSALISRSSHLVFENAFNRLRHQSPEIANTVAPHVFLKAMKEFGGGNFITAVKYIEKYKSLMDYSKLPRILNTAKENDNMAVSVVIVTYNRNEDLKKCLQPLSNQQATDFNFEVIVVDNGQSQLDNFKHYLDQYINCPINFNLAEGRNIGAYFARGDIVIFLDDDAVVGPDYISSIKSAFDRFDIFGLRGRTYPKSDTHVNNNVNIYDLGNKPFPSYCNQEGNSAFLRQVYRAMGGMDPLLFGHEGSDLTYRIIQEYKLPDRVIYWPGAVIYHDFGTAEKFKHKKEIHRRNETYLKYKHDTNIFADRTDIEKYPLPLKQSHQQHYYDISTPPERPEPYPFSSSESASHPGPKVSIVISCYNCEKFLPECLDSIRNQNMHQWELFLLDDASTDETRSIIERYARMDSRIKTYYFNDNKGPYARRNFAIQQASSDFIVIQDADDIMCPAKLELLYDEITKDDRLTVVGSFYRMFLEEFKGPQYADKVELPITHDEIIEHYNSARYICWHGSAIIRKALFEAIGLYDENPFGSDKLWLAKAAEYARYTDQIRFKNIPEYLTLKREHSSSQQGLLPTLDPRSRRAKFQTYWEYKLLKIRENLYNSPDEDIKTELKNCKCNDYIERYGCLFQQWESQPLDDVTLCRFISRAVKHFNKAKFVRCIIILDSVEKIANDATKRFKNYDFLRGMAYYAIDGKQQSQQYLNREIQKHNSPATKKFISDYFEDHSKTDVRKWCSENNSRYNLRMIDTEKETDAEQQSHNAPKWCISAWQDRQEDAGTSLPVAQADTGPLVTVIIPAYNVAKYIAKAIESVLSQNYQNFELIVINDGSTDRTEDIVRAFKDERIKYLYQENAGLANAHNVGIKSSKGVFVIKLDADDMMTPDFIARHLLEFEKCPQADLVYCDDRLIDEDDRTIRVIKRLEYSDRKSLIRDLFRCGFPVVPFRTCIRKSVFDKIGFFDESLLVAEDYDIMRRFVKHNLKIHHLPAALYLRRMTSEGLSRKYSAEKASSHFEVVKRFTDTFAHDELFPDVAWDNIAPQRRRLHAKCLAAATYLAIGQAYEKSNSPICAKTAFDLACSQLNECLKTEPENRLIQQLMQKSEILQARYQQAPQQAIR